VAKVTAKLPVPADEDAAAFGLTTCYAAGKCQADLRCPVRKQCRRSRWLEGDGDSFDEE
jgi:hypothetical protein